MTVSISKTLSSDLTVSLSSASGTGSFSPASVTISAGKTTSGPFTYTDSSVGTWTLTASATGPTSGSTSVTVVSGTLSTMTVGVSAGKVSKKGPNYRVPLTVTAADASTRAPLRGASVTFLVYPGSTCAGTAVASGSGTTGSTGQVGFTFSTRRTGAWCALADVTANGYSSNSGTTNFSTP